MASVQFFIILAVVVATLVPSILATEFTVGGETGWTNGTYDYQAWTQGKEFCVGDTLVFNYPKGKHNVLKVNGTAFQACDKSANLSAPLSSGNDKVPLTSTGKKWYICGFANHCSEGNQKLVITVSAASPAPAPSSATRGGVTPMYFGLLMAAFGILLMIMA